jgi:outer membrane immunogenic protein
MKKSLLASIAFVSFITGPAIAADMAVKAPLVAAAPSFNWSRCYGGVHAGYGWGKNTNDFGNAIASGLTEGGEGFPAEFGPFHHNTRGGVAGGQVGCNHQWAPNWLVGVEGELWWSGIKGGFTAPEDGTDPGRFSRFESRNRWDADLALRLGFVSGSNLFYAKAGAAVGNFRYDETHDDFPTTHGCPGGNECTVSLNQTKVGWLVGLGWETALPVAPLNHWTFKAEWNYIDYGTHNIAYPSVGAGLQSFPVKDTKNIVKVGLNFYFP